MPTDRAVYGWLRAHLPGASYPKPVCERLAVLVGGLLVTGGCTLGALAAAVAGLAVSAAPAERVERRLRRVLHDERLDPPRVLPVLVAALLPTLRAEVLERHAASARHGGRRHARRLPVRVVVDETSHTDRVHPLVAGLASRGVVVPRLVRTGAPNAPLAEGADRAHRHALRADRQALRPAARRDHVLLSADRACGVPWLLDPLALLGWRWLLRVQGQTRVLLRDGTTHALRSLVPCPGPTRFGRFDPRPAPAAVPGGSADPGPADPVPLAGVFEAAGWRARRVAAARARGADQPRLLLTDLAPSPDARLEYARRWGVARLFLSRKSHGWGLESGHVHDPARRGRLLTGRVLAPLRRLAAGVLEATTRPADLRRRAAGRAGSPRAVRQLPSPLDADLRPRPGASRPYAAKRSLVTRGTDLWEAIAAKRETPPLLWQFPDWDAPTWTTQARHAYAGLTP